MLVRALGLAVLLTLGIALVPGADWAFQLAYPLLLALGAASRSWWPILLVLAFPVWAGVDYGIDPYDDSDSVDSADDAALFALMIAVPIGAVAFACGKALRRFALALGDSQRSSS